jgi:hypothetical protein
MKFAHPIFAGQGQIELNLDRSSIQFLPCFDEITDSWKSLITQPSLQSISLYESRPGLKWGGIPVREEIYGSLLWAMYTDLAAIEWASMSYDGLAYERPYWQGHTLEDLLKSERSQTGLYLEYELQYRALTGSAMSEMRGAPVIFSQWIWSEVIRWQRLSEKMLQELGVTIDLLSPRNFRVITTGDGGMQLQPFDHGLVRPSPETVEYYRDILDIRIPSPSFQDAIGSYTVWPLAPEHIVTGAVWNLSFEQALQYLQVFHDCSEGRAVERLAHLPRWKIETAPFVEDFSNIDQAQQQRY